MVKGGFRLGRRTSDVDLNDKVFAAPLCRRLGSFVTRQRWLQGENFERARCKNFMLCMQDGPRRSSRVGLTHDGVFCKTRLDGAAIAQEENAQLAPPLPLRELALLSGRDEHSGRRADPGNPLP